MAPTWLHGVNAELGIFPSYIGLESYLPEEELGLHARVPRRRDAAYFFGFRGQAYTGQDFKVELWVVNGWQTFGQWHGEGRAGGYLWRNWRPHGWLSLVNSVYVGQEAQGDPDSAARLLRQQRAGPLLPRAGQPPAPVDSVLARGRPRLRAPRQHAVRGRWGHHADPPLGVDRAVEERAPQGLHLRPDARR